MSQVNNLETSARSFIGALSVAEVRLLAAVTNGSTAFCGPTDRDADAANNPGDANNWGADREVRADLIRWLCSDRTALDQIDARGIQLHAAKVTGGLDLSFLNIPCPLVFLNCFFPEPLKLRYAAMPQLNLSGSRVTSVLADLADIKGTMFLKSGFNASGQISLRGAKIGGNLNCDGAVISATTVSDAEDRAYGLNVEGARISGSLLMRKGFRGNRGIRLFLTQIGGNLECDKAEISNPAVAGDHGSGNAVDAEGAKIGGSVLLRSGFVATGGVRFFRAEIGGNFECKEARFSNRFAPKVRSSGWALNTEGAKISGSVFLREQCVTEGSIILRGCQVGGSLICDESRFTNPVDDVQDETTWLAIRKEHPDAGTALNAEMIKVAGLVSLSKASFEGRVRLFRADIGGNLRCEETSFKNPAQFDSYESGITLDAEAAGVGGDLLLRKSVMEGHVRLFGARVKGNFDCHEAWLLNPRRNGLRSTGFALNARGITVGGNLRLSELRVEGDLRLFGADIARIFDCEGSNFKSLPSKEQPDAVALDISMSKIGGAALFRSNEKRGTKFTAEGVIKFFACVIAGDFDCEGGTFSNPAQPEVRPSGVSLDGFAARISGSVLLRDNFVSYGQVQLSSATIGRSLDCGGGEFETALVKDVGHSSVALRAEAITVTGPVLLRNGFSSKGEVRLFGARIEENLDCHKGTFRADMATETKAALVASRAKIKGDLLLNDKFSADGHITLEGAEIDGALNTIGGKFESLDLSDASAGLIVDATESWRKEVKLKLELDGFTYHRISEGPLDAEERLGWLKRQPKFTRQPYRQLAKVLDETGDDVGAKQVLSAMQRRAWEERGKFGRFLSFILRWTIGYGYFPLRAFGMLIVLVLIGAIVYTVGYNFGSVVPNDKDAYPIFEKTCTLPPRYERFSPITYSLENTFPVVKLGIHDKWTPTPQDRAACSPSSALSWMPRPLSHPGLVRVFRWIQICLGWLLATLFVGGVTGILRKG